jgi:hypothetical protein
LEDKQDTLDTVEAFKEKVRTVLNKKELKDHFLSINDWFRNKMRKQYATDELRSDERIALPNGFLPHSAFDGYHAQVCDAENTIAFKRSSFQFPVPKD